MDDAQGQLSDRRQRLCVREDALGDRRDAGALGVVRMLAQGALEGSQMLRRVVRAWPREVKGVFEVEQGLVKAADQACCGAGDGRGAHLLDGAALDPAQHAMHRAVRVHPGAAVSGAHQPRCDQPAFGESVGDGLDVEVHLAREDGVQALEDVAPILGLDRKRSVDQPDGDGCYVCVLEAVRREDRARDVFQGA